MQRSFIVTSWVLAIGAIAIACSNPGGMSDAPVPDAGADAPVANKGVQIIELGPVTSGVATLLAVPAHTLGFHVVAVVDGSTGSETVGVQSIRSPSGEAVLTDFVPVGHAAPIGESPYGVIAVAVPQTSAQVAMPIEPGDWSLVFAAPAGRVTRARAYVRTSVDGEFHGGTLSVRIYIPDGLVIQDPTPAHAITAAVAATDPCVAARVDSFFATLENLFGIGRGNVEFIAIDREFDAIESDAVRLGALAETVAPLTGFAAHFVWTTRVELFGTRVWANSAWVPGTATHAGHALSGIVVDVSAGKPAAADGMTMLHELGHFLGLFHTTEANPAIHDPLSDTAACTSNASTCPDARNIMFPLFWGATGGIGLEATAQQRRVVHASPLYDSL